MPIIPEYPAPELRDARDSAGSHPALWVVAWALALVLGLPAVVIGGWVGREGIPAAIMTVTATVLVLMGLLIMLTTCGINPLPWLPGLGIAGALLYAAPALAHGGEELWRDGATGPADAFRLGVILVVAIGLPVLILGAVPIVVAMELSKGTAGTLESMTDVAGLAVGLASVFFVLGIGVGHLASADGLTGDAWQNAAQAGAGFLTLLGLFVLALWHQEKYIR